MRSSVGDGEGAVARVHARGGWRPVPTRRRSTVGLMSGIVVRRAVSSTSKAAAPVAVAGARCRGRSGTAASGGATGRVDGEAEKLTGSWRPSIDVTTSPGINPLDQHERVETRRGGLTELDQEALPLTRAGQGRRRGVGDGGGGRLKRTV